MAIVVGAASTAWTPPSPLCVCPCVCDYLLRLAPLVRTPSALHCVYLDWVGDLGGGVVKPVSQIILAASVQVYCHAVHCTPSHRLRDLPAWLASPSAERAFVVLESKACT